MLKVKGGHNRERDVFFPTSSGKEGGGRTRLIIIISRFNFGFVMTSSRRLNPRKVLIEKKGGS